MLSTRSCVVCRTYFLKKKKQMNAGKGEKPAVRNFVAKHAQRTGAGPHGKSKKAQRQADKQTLKKNLDDKI